MGTAKLWRFGEPNLRYAGSMNIHGKLGRQTATLLLLATCLATLPRESLADGVPVRFNQGLVHGFLVLKTLEGTPIADGDLSQVSRGGRVTTKLKIHFRDGSLHEETAVYTQRGQFRLLNNHLVQKGPAFKRQIETTLDATSGKFTAKYADEDGKEKSINERVKVPDDVVNGLALTALLNVKPGTKKTVVSMVAATPKPRVVKLIITPQGEEPFEFGASTRKVMNYAIKIDIGGVAGVVAPLVGKQPQDVHMWILQGETPAFIKAELALQIGGPVWRIELATPKYE
jgi:hypothetical protein